jgi:hypothetical protein
MESDYSPSHSILVQQSGTGSPSSLSVGNNTLVGRLSGGGSAIDDLSASQVRTLLNVEDGADVTDAANVASTITGAAAKTTLVDADVTVLTDSAASFGLKKVTWANVFAYIQTKLEAAANIVFTGQLRSTNQTAATGDALMTRDLGDARYYAPIYAVKANDQSKTNDDTFANDSDLIINLTTGTWIIEGEFIFLADNTTAGIKAQINFSGTQNNNIGFLRIYSATGTTGGHGASVSANSTRPDVSALPTLPRGIGLTGANRTGISSVKHCIVVTGSGNYSLQWAQNVSDAGATKLEAGSHLIATKIA